VSFAYRSTLLRGVGRSTLPPGETPAGASESVQAIYINARGMGIDEEIGPESTVSGREPT
jgi:hypothetical protein